MTLRTRFLRRTLVAAISALALVAVLPTSAAGGRQAGEIAWQSPTPAHGKSYKIAAGSKVSFSLAATLPGNLVPIEIAAASACFRRGAKVASRPGVPASARFTWSPSAKQAGVHQNQLRRLGAGLASAPLRSVTIRVAAIQQALLSDRATEIYRWAYVTRRTSVRSAPSARARSVGSISTVTPSTSPTSCRRSTCSATRTARRGCASHCQHAQQQDRLGAPWQARALLEGEHAARGQPQWVAQRSTGAASRFSERPSASASHAGRRLDGDFYVREILSGYNMPAYGPIAFGLSARSNVLTDWLGGGFIGIHGTNQPGILPGRVSHGCIRMRNSAVLRLRRLMPLGTPVVS